MTDILLSIQDKLIQEVSALKYVDEDWGQLDDYGPNAPVQWPCSLIDISAAQYTNLGQDRTAVPVQRQEGTVMISISFANLKLTNSSAKAPMGQKQKAFILAGIVEDAHKVLQGFRPVEKQGVLIRSSFGKVKRDDGVQLYKIIYSIGLHNV